MKTMILAAALLSAPAFAAGGLQDGTYKGAAEWKGGGATGTYDVVTTVANGTVSSTYNFAGQTKTWNFTVKDGADGLFDVLSNGQKVGDGYCYDVQCHYTAFDGALEETLTFYQNNLYKLGSKTAGTSRTVWQESLSKTSH